MIWAESGRERSPRRLFNRFGARLQIHQLVTDFGRTMNLVANSIREARADLARALGEDRPGTYQLTEPAAAPAPPAEAAPLIAQAIQNRPELSSLRLQYEAAKKFEAPERDLSRPKRTSSNRRSSRSSSRRAGTISAWRPSSRSPRRN